jgi:hypothetical protein
VQMLRLRCLEHVENDVSDLQVKRLREKNRHLLQRRLRVKTGLYSNSSYLFPQKLHRYRVHYNSISDSRNIAMTTDFDEFIMQFSDTSCHFISFPSCPDFHY